jgi:VCBS repeat-containing protein
LQLERLEVRLVPSSGEIHGTIWNDSNGNGVRDAGEVGQSGVTVYLDLNQNGQFDSGEPWTMTGADGSYAFTGLTPGTYMVGVALPGTWQQTAPVSPPTRSVTIPGAPTTINFNSLTSPSDQAIGPYHQAGFTLDTSVNQPDQFQIFGTANTARYAGETMATSYWSPATITLSQDNGQAFNLTAMDLASIWNSIYYPTVTFTGNRSDGTSVQQAFTLSNQLIVQTETFTGFTNLTSVQWNSTGFNDYHQFTNIVVSGAGAPIATGADLGITSYPRPDVSVANALVQEGSGVAAQFTVRLSNTNPYPITVNYTTADGAAVAGQDYVATAGALTIPANQIQATISVPILNDNVGKPDRTFSLNLLSATNAVITYGHGLGTIEDDDVVVASNDSYTITGGALSVAAPGVLGNDTPANGTALAASLVSGPPNGTLNFSSNGSFTYTPGTGFTGTDTFTYQALEGPLQSNVATVTITTNSANQPPVAANDSYTLNENQTLIVGAHSTTSLYLNSQPGDWVGQGQTATYTANTGTFLVQRNSDNGVSVYYQDASNSWSLDFAAPQNATLTPGYYGNVARFPFQASNQPGLDVSGDGRGSDTLTGNFTVKQAVYDASGNVVNFDATFEQHSEGATPALFGEVKYYYAPGPAGVLLNDFDQEGELLSAILVSGPVNGTLSLNANGSFVYTPNPNFAGTDSFIYKANDGADSNVATVTITVNPVNQAPSFTAGANQLVTENSGAQTAPGWATIIAAGPPNESGQAVNFLVSNDNNALFSVQPAVDPTGTLTYTPAANAYGIAHVTMQLHDNGGTANGGVDTSTPQTFTITVNDPPVAVNDTYAVTDGQTLNVTTQGTTSLSFQSQLGDWIGGRQVLTYTPATGQFSVSRNPANGVSFSYFDTNPNVLWMLDFAAPQNATLTPGYYGNATRYPFQAANVPALNVDGEGHGSNTLAGNFTVLQAYYDGSGNVLNFDARFEQHSEGAAPALFGEIQYNALSSLAGVLANDVDHVGNPLAALLVSGPAHGKLTLNSNGTFSYSPNLGFTGTDSFTYEASDGYLTSNSATVTITVNPAAASTLQVSGFPTTVSAGVAGTFTVTARDPYGNVATGYRGTVHFTSGDPRKSLPGNYTFTAADSGIHTFTATLRTAGSQSISAADTVTSSITGAQTGIVVTPNVVTHFNVALFPSPEPAGVTAAFRVIARDAYNNTVPTYTGTLHFTSSDPNSAVRLPANYTFTNRDKGIHTFNATLVTAGTQSLTATDTVTGSITGSQTGIVITPAVLHHFRVYGFPNPTVAGVAHTVWVQAKDIYGNIVTSYTGTIVFTSSDSLAVLPGSYTFTTTDNGMHSFIVTLKTTGMQSITVKAQSDSTKTGMQSNIQVNPAGATSFGRSGLQFNLPTVGAQLSRGLSLAALPSSATVLSRRLTDDLFADSELFVGRLTRQARMPNWIGAIYTKAIHTWWAESDLAGF